MSRKISVTIVCHQVDLSLGGSSFSLDITANLLVEKGYKVRVITVNPENNKIYKNKPYEIISINDKSVPTRFGVLISTYRIMKKYESVTDIYHIWAPNLLPPAGYYRSRHDTPVVGRLNSYTLFCVNHDLMDGQCHNNCSVKEKFMHDDNFLLKRIAKIPSFFSRTKPEMGLSKMVDQMLAVSPAVKKVYMEAGVPEALISVVPNFYNPSFADGVTSSKKSDTLRALYVGRLKRSKGVGTLLRAIKQTSEVTATIIGPGPKKEDLELLRDELGIAERVRFKGLVDHGKLSDYYCASDVFVQPARWPEPFSRTLLESMQCQTPAIVSSVGGSSWAVGDAGISFSPGRPAELASIISSLYRNTNRIRELERKCDEQIEKFAPCNVISRLEKVYDQYA
ncbi:glycosyltransferase family 4 protein [Salinibacter ruber]|uniref:glycosyltransferase family 4 protein n=1 Tax=Salinibacter ruber TaxID=146919 RepID=UPI0021674E5D|nr:glycosyltransferase family 4 protein [Salinibacter ruber]MCS4150728.1 glycosyltransferase involved in cell wall biosynthesis [Salinibacter ruber]